MHTGTIPKEREGEKQFGNKNKCSVICYIDCLWHRGPASDNKPGTEK